jgi:hypothetical protein
MDRHMSMMRSMMGSDPFMNDPFFRDPFDMMDHMHNDMVSLHRFLCQASACFAPSLR